MKTPPSTNWLQGIAETVRQAEGWKWADVHIDYPHAHGLRRTYPQPVALSEEDEAAYAAASEAFNQLTEEWDSAEELPDDVDGRFGKLEAEIERIEALRHAYDADNVSRGGVFVVVSHDGKARIERGFIRAEDEQPEAEAEARPGGEGYAVNDDGEIIEHGIRSDLDGGSNEEEAEDDGKPLSDLLVRDLTAHRTLGLRLALGDQPDIALVAVTHTLAAQAFYQGMEAHCLEIRPTSTYLAGHADGIEDTAAGKALADRHAAWAADLPRDVGDLWSFVISLDHASVMALFAHCASLTVNAVKQPWERKPRAHETANRLATAASLDMTAHWRPTVRTYLGRVTKAHILEAVREAASEEAVDRLSALKKQPMAEAAEQLLAGTGWLPAVLRTPEPTAHGEQHDVTDAEAAASDEPQADLARVEADLVSPDSAASPEENEPFHVAAE